ncbi:CHAP domain-containing protein [bacterium]|nr:CHAP domain-containing protein [bacterium]
MNIKKATFFILPVIVVIITYKVITNVNINPNLKVGEVVDSLNDVEVYYNGGVNHVLERNKTPDGYNIGLKYQCVEFVKRYYLEHFNHRMPDTYGHAKDFFDETIAHGDVNPKRGLKQYRNNGNATPEGGDLLVYKPSITNPYGHVAIVSHVDLTTMEIEIVQQNPGPFSPSRETYPLKEELSGWHIDNDRIVGWLRMTRDE